MATKIPATKTNLLRIKKTLALTEEGYELLDEKRRLLMTELTAIIYIVDKFQRSLDEALFKAYDMVDKATIVMGRKRLEDLVLSVDIKSTISVFQKRVMGVNIPTISLETTDNLPSYSSPGVSLYADEVIVSFKELLALITQLAEKKIALLRIAKEVQKTIRKVNALEKIHIPFFKETLKNITNTLEEESREAFSMLKLIKERLGR